MATQDNIDAIKSLTDAAYPNVRNDTVSQLDATNALIGLHQEDYYDLFNADTAKRLKTPRLIGGVPFDGTADIVLPGVNTKGNQDTSGHSASADNANHANDSDKSLLADKATALKTPRKINGVEFDGTSDININSSNAEVANKLKTPRLIGGVPFDGTTDIVLPGVNSKGNQDTSGHAASADTANSSNNAGHANKADSAAKLQTPRKINGTNFDGTADINVNAANDSNLVHRTGDESIAGGKSFSDEISFNKLINGALKTRLANFTNFSTVATNMLQYAGTWYVLGGTITGAPYSGNVFAIIEVIPGSTNTNGIIKFTTFFNGAYFDGLTYVAVVTSAGLGQWIRPTDDSKVMHLAGTETVPGDKTFTGMTTLNNVVSSNVKNASITALGFTVSLAETALGVNVNVVGSGISLLADNSWHILGNMPANITKPKINMYSSMTFAAPAGSTSTNTGFTLRVSFNTTGEIDYKIISLREGDKTNYTVTFDSFLSTTWAK